MHNKISGISNDILERQRVKTILSSIKDCEASLRQNSSDSSAYHILGMHFAALANICEKSSDLANGLRLYNEALESYNHAIKLDNKQEDYYASREILPMMVMDPESRHKLFKNVIYLNFSNIETLQDTKGKVSKSTIDPLRFKYDYIETSLKNFKEKEHNTAIADQKSYTKETFIGVLGAILGGLGLVGLGLSLVIALPVAIAAGVIMMAGTYYLGKNAYDASKKVANIEHNKEVDDFLQDELQKSITQRQDVLQKQGNSTTKAQNTNDLDKKWSNVVKLREDNPHQTALINL